MAAQQEVTLRVVFHDRSLSTMVLNQIFSMAKVAVEIVRGRLSAHSAWFDLRIRGDARAVARIVKFSSPWSVFITCPEAQLA